MDCAINIKPNGSVSVRDYPKLYNEALGYTNGDPGAALLLYGVILKPEFQELGIENPKLENILSFLTEDSLSEYDVLSGQDRISLLNLSLNGSESSDTIQQFVDAFTVDGVFNIDVNQLLDSGLFTELEVHNMVDYLDELKDIYYKLRNYTGVEKHQSMQYDFTEGVLTDKSNPDVIQDRIIHDYFDLDSEEAIYDRAMEIGDEIVLDTENGPRKVLELVKNYTSQYSYEYVNGNLIKRSAGIKNDLINSLDLETDYTEYLEALDILIGMFESGEMTREFLEEYLPALKEASLQYNIDISTIMDAKEFGRPDILVEKLSVLSNILYDIQEGNSESIEESLDYLEELVGANDKNVSRIVRPRRDNFDVNDFHLETQESEYNLFEEHGIIRMSRNTYRKVDNSQSLDDLYVEILNNSELLPGNIFSVKVDSVNITTLVYELDQYITNQVGNNLEPGANISNAKLMEAHKLLEGAEPREYSKVPYGTLDLEGFHKTIHRLMIASPRVKELLYFSSRGLESYNTINEYTSRLLEIELGEELYADLITYAQLTQSESLSGLKNTIPITESSVQDPRLFYTLNPSELPQFKGAYSESGYYSVDSTHPFIRIGDKILEKTDHGIYQEIQDGLPPIELDVAEPKPIKKITLEPQIKTAGPIADDTIEFC